jgi:hypothetical protein
VVVVVVVGAFVVVVVVVGAFVVVVVVVGAFVVVVVVVAATAPRRAPNSPATLERTPPPTILTIRRRD